MQTEFEYGQLQSRIWPCGWKWKFIEGIPKSKRKSLWMTIIECESVFLFFAHYLCDYWNFFTFSSYNPMSKVRYLKTNARHANKMPGINGRIHQDTVNVAIRVPLPFLWFSSKVRLRLAIRFFSFLFFVQWSVYSITLLFYMECDNDELSKRNKSEIDANWWISRQFLPINFLLSRCISLHIVWHRVIVFIAHKIAHLPRRSFWAFPIERVCVFCWCLSCYLLFLSHKLQVRARASLASNEREVTDFDSQFRDILEFQVFLLYKLACYRQLKILHVSIDGKRNYNGTCSSICCTTGMIIHEQVRVSRRMKMTTTKQRTMDNSSLTPRRKESNSNEMYCVCTDKL